MDANKPAWTKRYTVAQRIEVEGVTHDVGAEVDLNDDQAQSLLERQAVVPIEPAPRAAGTVALVKAAAKIDAPA